MPGEMLLLLLFVGGEVTHRYRYVSWGVGGGEQNNDFVGLSLLDCFAGDIILYGLELYREASLSREVTEC